MKNSGNKIIDIEKENLENQTNNILSAFQDRQNNRIALKNSLKSLNKDLLDHRMKLAYNKGTENYESKFEWTLLFDNLNKEMDLVIDGIQDINNSVKVTK